MLNATHEPGEIYPDAAVDTDLVKANLEIRYLLSLSPERRRATRVYTGHFPFFVTELLETDLMTTTILRDPVERTISYLQMKIDQTECFISPENLYAYPGLNESHMQNFQTKQFAMTVDDRMRRAIDTLPMDDDRLALAKDNLAKVDLIGLHDRHEEFLDAATRKFGWQTRSAPPWHVSQPVEISASLRDRITRRQRDRHRVLRPCGAALRRTPQS